MSGPFCRWRRNQDGAVCRKSVKKMLEVLVVKPPLSESWALPGVSQGELSVRSVHPTRQPNTSPLQPPHLHPPALDSVPGPEGQTDWAL